MTPIKEPKDDQVENIESPAAKSNAPGINPQETPKEQDKVTKIPGLSKSQQKKALRKAKATGTRSKTGDTESKTKTNIVGETATKNNARKDFMKNNIFDNLASDFHFDERSTDEEEEPKTADQPKSKFFTKSPLEKMSQKEEEWNSIVMEQTKKRQSSPGDSEDRNTRPRSESCSFSFAPGPIKKLYK